MKNCVQVEKCEGQFNIDYAVQCCQFNAGVFCDHFAHIMVNRCSFTGCVSDVVVEHVLQIIVTLLQRKQGALL